MHLSYYLERFGLTEKEAVLYLAGLKTGPATLQGLADASKLKRATIYDLISSLREQGLLKVFMKGKRRMYTVEEPANLFSLLKQKEHALNYILKDLKALQSTGNTPSVRIFQGIEGIKEIYEDLLSRRANYIEVLSAKLPDERILDYWINDFVPRRIKRGNFVKIIAPDLPLYRKLKERDKYSLRETRILPAISLPPKNEIFAYRDKTAFITHEEDRSLGLLVESADMYETMNLILKRFWDTTE